MDSMARADIFFFVTTIVTMLLGIAFIVLLIFLIKIARNAEHIAKAVRKESDEIIADLDTMRASMRTEGFKVRHIARFVGRLKTRKKITKT